MAVGIVLDYDSEGRIVGIEVMDARWHLSPELLDRAAPSHPVSEAVSVSIIAVAMSHFRGRHCHVFCNGNVQRRRQWPVRKPRRLIYRPHT